MNYYPFHLGDYAAHTAHLEPMEDLAYRRMLDLYYRTEKALPLSIEDIGRLIRLRDNQAAIRDVLNEFFVQEGDGWHSKRADAELEAMQCKRNKAQASAAKRWDSKPSKPSNANAMPTHSERIANAMPTQCEGNAPNTNTNTNTKDKRSAARSALPARPDSVGEQVWNDWLALRAKKRAPVTATVLRSAESEADKAGMPLEEFLRVWCARGSQGLEAEWLKPKAQTLRAEPSSTVPSRPEAIYVPPPPLTAEEREAAELARQRAMQAINRRQAA